MKKNVNLLALLLLPPLAISATAQGQVKTQPKDNQLASRVSQSLAVRPAAATNDPNFVIGPEDMLDINVWKEPDISRTVPVRPDGKISLPLLNDVQAAGQTPLQLGLAITERLRKYLTQPQVTVIVLAINSRRVYLLGEVARPGAYPLLPGMTVLQALSTAGGFSQYANQKKIYLLRSDNGKQRKFPFNYKDVIQGKRTEQNIPLEAGDTIVVP